MPSPVGPNAPNRAFGTTPPAEQQPAPPAEPQQAEAAWQPVEAVETAADRKALTEIQAARVPFTSIAQDPPAPAGGSNTTDTD